MAQTIDFVSLLHKSQEYISENYAAALSDRSKIVQLRSYIEKYLHDSGFEVEGMTFRELADKLYSEMAEYSVLTKYLGRDEIEEININGWDDIAVTYTDGHIEKAKEHFYNPQHAVKKLFCNKSILRIVCKKRNEYMVNNSDYVIAV